MTRQKEKARTGTGSLHFSFFFFHFSFFIFHFF